MITDDLCTPANPMILQDFPHVVMVTGWGTPRPRRPSDEPDEPWPGEMLYVPLEEFM